MQQTIFYHFGKFWNKMLIVNSFFQIKDGKIDGEAIKASAPKQHKDNKKFLDAVTACQSANNPDRCELAVQFIGCMDKFLGQMNPM